jgi:hypothetical protein
MDTGGSGEGEKEYFKEYYLNGELRYEEYIKYPAGDTYNIQNLDEATFFLDEGAFECRESSAHYSSEESWEEFECFDETEKSYLENSDKFFYAEMIKEPDKYSAATVKEVGGETVVGQETRCFETSLYGDKIRTHCLNEDGVILKTINYREYYENEIVVTNYEDSVEPADMDITSIEKRFIIE